uniref:Uncharacterized protein n=1 Tax=Anguilla anguilla TaxID=7936 RepID=A0A0E9TDF8_ANGAN
MTYAYLVVNVKYLKECFHKVLIIPNF